MIYLSQKSVCIKNTFKDCLTMQFYINAFNRGKMDKILPYDKRAYECVPSKGVI
jgi:hypothetical protein